MVYKFHVTELHGTTILVEAPNQKIAEDWLNDHCDDNRVRIDEKELDNTYVETYFDCLDECPSETPDVVVGASGKEIKS